MPFCDQHSYPQRRGKTNAVEREAKTAKELGRAIQAGGLRKLPSTASPHRADCVRPDLHPRSCRGYRLKQVCGMSSSKERAKPLGALTPAAKRCAPPAPKVISRNTLRCVLGPALPAAGPSACRTNVHLGAPISARLLCTLLTAPPSRRVCCLGRVHACMYARMYACTQIQGPGPGQQGQGRRGRDKVRQGRRGRDRVRNKAKWCPLSRCLSRWTGAMLWNT